jgi:hypothetical protein
LEFSRSNIQISPDASYRDLDGEGVVLDLARGKYYGLDESAGRIWQLLQESGNVQQVVAAMATEYQVDREQLLKDVTAFVGRLHALGLVTCTDSGAGKAIGDKA